MEVEIQGDDVLSSKLQSNTLIMMSSCLGTCTALKISILAHVLLGAKKSALKSYHPE